MSRSTVRRAASSLALIVALLAVAPAAASATTPDPGGDTTPATEAPDTVPVTVTTPDTVTPDGGGGDDVPWPLIIAGGAALIALIALIAALSRRGSSSSAPTTTTQQTPGAASHHNQAAQDRGYALGSAQWVHDNFTMELLAASPETALRRWNADRARLDDATIRAQRFSTDPQHGVAWQSLAQTLSLLSSSVDTLIQLRNADDPDQRLITEATDVVQRHRTQLSNDIATLWPTIQT